MFRALTLASLFAAVSGIASAQAPALVTLHIKITLKSSAQTLIPVPRHALLISDNPATTSPRRVVTTPDGTVDVKLRPGNYTVESDEPVTFEGKGYQWTRTVQVTAGRDLVLDLTADNAEIGAATASSASDALKENDPSFLLPAWQNSVVLVWTPESRASGFLVEATGLVVTSQRVIGSASAVEVQLTPTVKVAARVLVADRVRDVAVLWIDPAAAADVRPVPLGCEHAPVPAFTDRQRLITIGAPLKGPKELSPGAVIRVASHNNAAREFYGFSRRRLDHRRCGSRRSATPHRTSDWSCSSRRHRCADLSWCSPAARRRSSSRFFTEHCRATVS